MSGLLFVWPWAGRDVDRQEKDAEGPAAFGSGGQNHPWAVAGPVVARTVCSSSNHTRPMSWLGPASSGAHPRTKGARFCAGGHRHRIPLTAKGLRMARTGKPSGDPSQRRKECRRGERAGCGSRRSHLQVPRPGPAGRDAHTEQEGVARWGVPQGMRDTGHAADGGHGSRGTGAVRRLCGHRHWYGVDARHHAWTCRLPPAACLCSRGSDCTTRTGRSCRFAGAWVRRTADKPVLGEP